MRSERSPHLLLVVLLVGGAAIWCAGALEARQQPAVAPTIVAVRPIQAPSTPLPPESASAGVTTFSFIAYGDTRSGSEPNVPGDGQIIQADHNRLVDLMLAKAEALASTPYPIRFIVQSGDAVLRGQNGAMWNVSFAPIIDRLSRANLPYFFGVGNHDVTSMPQGDPGRSLGLHNTLTAISKLIPPEGSPRRLGGYPTYSFGYGNAFFITFDSNIAPDTVQFAWVKDQLEHLDRARFPIVIVFFHHPPFTSGQHGGPTTEPQSIAIRDLYMPLFRAHHVRMVLAGHDHLLDHWVERYTDAGGSHRIDAIVTGGGGAPTYRYTGEPDLTPYLDAGQAQNVRVEHLMRPGPTVQDNPHHFLVVRVDGSQISLEVVGIGPGAYAPYKGRATIDLN
jgi:hypothetical protein